MPTMSGRVARKLPSLAADYEQVTGSRFEHFLCPILYVDEDVELCEAHVVNKAFRASSVRTVQRKDVDGFYGSMFESDFVDLKHRSREVADVITDPSLAKRLRARIMADGRLIDHYAPTGTVPSEHSRVIMGGPGGEIPLILKLPPHELAALATAHWGLVMEKDLRIPALVSSLKAAHLTLFNILGYTYALSAGGHFLGYEVLGKFFRKTVGRPKAEVLAEAHSHFHEFAHMMRPMPGLPAAFRGTADEKAVYLCQRGTITWGIMVMVRTVPGPLEAVLVPVLGQPVAAQLFLKFLRDASNDPFDIRLAWFRGGRWEAAGDIVTAHWPKTGFLFPEEPNGTTPS